MWSYVDSSWPLIGTFGSAVMYKPGKVLKCGGTAQPGSDENLTAVIDLNDPSETGGEWLFVDSMEYERRHHNLVLLPTGEILAVGGERDADPDPDNEDWVPVMPAELFDPNDPVPHWEELAPMIGDPRDHHSTAVLLASAKVLVCGGDEHPESQTTYESAEIFSPPYLFLPGGDDAPRPVIGYAPRVVTYGSDFSVILSSGSPVGATQIGKVSFVRLGSTTHGFDMDQRYVPLAFQVDPSQLPAQPSTLIVQAPADGSYAPPGYYMLFVVSDAGVPSIAKYVRLYEPASI